MRAVSRVLQLQRMLAHLPDDVTIVRIGAPPGRSPCVWLLVDDVTVAVRVCSIMAWARVGDTYLELGEWRCCAHTQWSLRVDVDLPTHEPKPKTPTEYAAVIADVARRAVTHRG